tara:strand:+ start:261 stop:980 length:720 start_codon:yes stop_codon:yes gene_type:complete
MPLGAIIGAGASVIGGLIGSSSAKKQARAAAREKRRLQRKLDNLEQNRQQIINPFEDVKSLAGFAQDLSSQISNPFANLGVATKAAEIQMEQSDLALAATLDTLRATGASAGGATALANAALKSKQNVSANIEQQEAQNEKLRAQGEQQMEQMKIAEQRRMQNILISEGAREQSAEAAGKQFVFGAREQREMQEIDRTAAMLSAATQSQAQAKADQTSALTGMFGTIAQAGLSGAFNKP